MLPIPFNNIKSLKNHVNQSLNWKPKFNMVCRQQLQVELIVETTCFPSCIYNLMWYEGSWTKNNEEPSMSISFENRVVCEVIKTQYFIILFDNCQGIHTESPPPIPPSESSTLLHKIILFPSQFTMKAYFLQITAMICLQVPWRYDYNKWWQMSVPCKVFWTYFVLTEAK